ncbi:MAG: NUDIX domain-containing protein [Bacteroides sp.]|nr:NUDIX domain-containing protein [Bacteroides sp.]MCM1084932.1 NUDIX domain-containing protein [Bacteroides sp.]
MNRIFFGSRELYFTDREPAAPCRSVDFGRVSDWPQWVRREFTDTYACVLCKDPDADFSRFLQQFPIVEAAGGIVQAPFPDGSQKYLYIFRNGLWDLPKGKKEKGEDDSTNALREVEEETGLRGLEILRYLDHTFHFMPGKDGVLPVKQTAWFSMKIPAPQQAVPQTEEGIEKAEWLSVQEVKQRLGLMFASVATLSDRFLISPCGA